MFNRNYTPKEEKLDNTCAEREWTVEGRVRRKNVRESSSRQAEGKMLDDLMIVPIEGSKKKEKVLSYQKLNKG